MDQSSENSKRKFKPRAPKPSLRPIAPAFNNEANAEEENRKAARALAKSIGTGHRKPKAETKASSSSLEVAFQPNHSIPAHDVKPLQTVCKEDVELGSDNVNANTPPPPADILPLSYAAPRNDLEDVDDNLDENTVEAYAEPWDYENSYYPTVLPWRKPNSGDPELLDQEEFGEVAKHPGYDERTVNSAAELGLTSEQHKQMFFFKIPDCLPIVKKPAEPKTKKPVVLESSSTRNNPFEGLPQGFMGKMLVYKSGKVKLKLGDVLFDVFPGPDAKSYSDVVAVDTKERKCCQVGSSPKFATVTPDVESLLNSASDMK